MTLERPDKQRPVAPAVEAAFPLTPLQEGMLYHALRTPGAGVYHGRAVVELAGPMSVELFQEAWRMAARRHEAFRTFFAWERRERPVQVVLAEIDLLVELLDWTALSGSERARQREVLLRSDLEASPDSEPGTAPAASRAPMMRWVLATLGAETHELLWSFNHAVLDGWSALLLLNEVLEDYDDLVAGRTPRERSRPPSYARFVSWMAARDSVETRAFWRRSLEGVQGATPIPTSRGERASTERTTTDGWLTEAETRSLRLAAATHRVTTNTLVVAAWALVLGRHAGTDDVVTGMTLSERPHELPGVERAAGLYLSTIPIRVRLDGKHVLGAWLRDMQGALADARAHSGPSLADIQRWSAVEGDSLVRSLVVFESFPQEISGSDANCVLSMRSVEMSGPSDLPLALLALPGARLRLQLVHDPAQISAGRAKALLHELRAALVAVSGDAEDTVDAVIERLRSEVAPAPSALPGIGPALDTAFADVVDLFDRQVGRTPDAIAIRAGSASLTYRALNVAAVAVSRQIQSAGLAPGALVGLLGSRTPATVAAMFGALKANCAYAPLDPALPPARLTTMAAGLDAVMVLDGHEQLVEQWPVPLLREGSAEPPASASSVRRATTPQAAYVIHTSGSTGEPKGVMVSRGQLAWSTSARFAYYGQPPGVFLLLSSLAVDSSVAGVYGTLCGGGTLLLPDAGTEQNVVQLARLIQAERVTDTLLVPSLYGEILDAGEASQLASLQRVIVAGETCPDDLPLAHHTLLPDVALYNEYGPSEATVWATVDDLSARPRPAGDAESGTAPVTIGRPVAMSRVYLVDAELRLVPHGDVGEILIGGPGVAMGYLGKPALTAERFMPDPWHPGGRVYRTGDRARWLADGRLEFLGRADDQIKVRGYRVEPAEVETALQAHPLVSEALVGLSTRAGSEGQLMALLRCASDTPSRRQLDAFLNEQLPRYMIPSRMLMVDRLPRTPAGKLDRTGIDRRHGVELGEVRQATTAPRSETERTLVGVWKSVLGIEDIGIHDDFFEIGGDSLLSIRAISRSARAGIPVSPASFFAAPTIAQIAVASTGTEVAQGPVTGEGHLTPIQHWFFEQFGGAPHQWNQAFLLKPARTFSTAAVQRAVTALLVHHDALRLRFAKDADSWRPTFTDPASTTTVQSVDLTDLPEDQRDDRMLAVANEVHASLNIDRGELFRVVVFDVHHGAQQLLLLAHHLVVDAISWGILIDDLATLLSQDAPGGGAAAALPAKTRSLLEWSDALRTAAADPQVEEMSSLWTRRAQEGWSRVPRDLPGADAENRTSTAQHHLFRLSAARTSALLEAANGPAGPTVQELTLAGLLLGWRQWTGRAQLRLDLESHGRDVLGTSFDVSRTVGWFTSVFPVGLELRGGDAVSALAAVREALPGSGLRKASYGLLRYLHPDSTHKQQLESLGGSELLFNYLGSLDGMIELAAPFVQLTHSVGSSRGAQTPRAYVIEINSWIEAGHLTFDVEYSTALHTPESVARFGDAIAQGLHAVAESHGETKFELAGLDAEGVDRLADLLADLDAG